MQVGVGLAMQYGALNQAEEFYSINESGNETNACALISWYYARYPSGCIPFNNYWYFTDAEDVRICLEAQATGEYADWVINFWVGDFRPSDVLDPAPYGHLWLYGKYENERELDISDNLVFTHSTVGGTQASYENVNFIWTCCNGGRYWTSPGVSNEINGITISYIPDNLSQPTFTPVNTNTMYGFIDNDGTEVGMPFAWTGCTDLSLNGYSSSDNSNYCYIGFEGPSPGLSYTLPNSQQLGYDFANSFYYYAITNLLSVHDALNSASLYCYGTANFASTPLYQGWWWTANGFWWFTTMRVLGDSLYCSPG